MITLEHFLSRVQKTSTCWLFCKLDRLGYGEVNVTWLGSRIRLAHRLSWILHGRTIPDGMKLLHKCDVRNCVNPDHCFVGTQLDNIKDRNNKGRQAKGEQNHSKLKEEDVLFIRHQWNNGLSNQTRLGLVFGVSGHQISMIVRGKLWKHVT